LAICFNPWDERPLKYCDEVIKEKDLSLVLDLIKAKMNG